MSEWSVVHRLTCDGWNVVVGDGLHIGPFEYDKAKAIARDHNAELSSLRQELEEVGLALVEEASSNSAHMRDIVDLVDELEEAKPRAGLADWLRQTLRHRDSQGNYVGGDAMVDALDFIRRYDALVTKP